MATVLGAVLQGRCCGESAAATTVPEGICQMIDGEAMADIKVILKVSSPYYQFDELMEVQLIQKINISCKKLEHLL